MENRKYDKLFVGGDLSGIQRFLYNIATDNASVSLKGRSHYLSHYMRSDVYERLRKAVEGCNGSVKELYCSGGKFYFITDNTQDINDAITRESSIITQELWNEHRGQLGLNISSLSFCEQNGRYHVEGHADDSNTSSGVLWKYLNADFAKMKNQRFKSLLISDYADFFEPRELGGSPKVCALTGVESTDCKQLPKEKNSGKVYLPSVIEQITMGKKLAEAEGLKPFSEYAGSNNSFIGILRMDVDGMGKKFIQGFDTLDDYQNFSNRATKFFEQDIQGKLLKELDSEGKPYIDSLNVIYAGGDDLFIVGRWDKVIDFAKLIHDRTEKEFEGDTYTDPISGKKCHISISGGIAIVKQKFPIAKAAELAGNAEDAAKNFNHGEKNAFHFLGKTVSWDDRKPFGNYDSEYAFVEHYKNKFVNLIQKYSLSKGLLHKIMLYASIAEQNKRRTAEGKPENFSFIWHLSYYLTRYMGRYEGNDDVTSFCRHIRDMEITGKNGRKLELLALSARWAELLLRKTY